jgi:hypothetical protein
MRYQILIKRVKRPKRIEAEVKAGVKVGVGL